MCDHVWWISWNWWYFVELKSNRNWHNIKKSTLFLGRFMGTPNSCQNFQHFFFEVNKKSVERQTFQLSFGTCFSIQKMVTTWCLSGPTIGWVIFFDLLCHVSKNSFFEQILSLRLSPHPFPFKNLWKRLHFAKVSKGQLSRIPCNHKN